MCRLKKLRTYGNPSKWTMKETTQRNLANESCYAHMPIWIIHHEGWWDGWWYVWKDGNPLEWVWSLGKNIHKGANKPKTNGQHVKGMRAQDNDHYRGLQS